ncbi:group-specific protein [Bacillus xiapuensis]|uniref:group-specific protein n=1 Tax=Bacillus xiapuensis TaxID=2014075 RepID=UPI000C231F5A|nr:group-specific protein [Bacillus xiapuensis]
MGKCQIDHSLEDVKRKLASQQNFLSGELYQDLQVFLQKTPTQAELNEAFHLLKKYDLSPEEEQERRNQAFRQLMNRQ